MAHEPWLAPMLTCLIVAKYTFTHTLLYLHWSKPDSGAYVLDSVPRVIPSGATRAELAQKYYVSLK